MQRIANGSQLSALPTPDATTGTPGYFGRTTDGAPGPTKVGRDWLNAVQEELVAIILGTGGTLSSTTLNQIWTGLVATFAKLASPAFTGNPTAPTQSSGDNSTKIATTAFVQGKLPLSGYLYGVDTSGSANTVTVALTPALGAYAAGQAFKLKIANTNTGATAANLGPSSVAIQWNGRALVGGELVTGKIVEVIFDGTSLQIQGLTAISGSNANGTYRISQDGFIEQWMRYTSALTSEGPIAMTYPIAFATACLGASAIVNNSGSTASGDTQMQVVGLPGLSSATFYVQDASAPGDAAGGFFAKVEGY